MTQLAARDVTRIEEPNQVLLADLRLGQQRVGRNGDFANRPGALRHAPPPVNPRQHQQRRGGFARNRMNLRHDTPPQNT
jgi:hypothetical protein